MTEELDVHHLLICGQKVGIDATIEEIEYRSDSGLDLSDVVFFFSVKDGECTEFFMFGCAACAGKEELSSDISWVLTDCLEILDKVLLGTAGACKETW